MKTKRLAYRECTSNSLVSDSDSEPSPKLSVLDQLWQAIKRALFRSSEPQVWQEYVTRRDANGECSVQVQWYAYDPLTQRSAYCYSEAEMRAWLDQLLHQDAPQIFFSGIIESQFESV